MVEQIKPVQQNSEASKRQRYRAAAPEIEKIHQIMRDSGFCPSAIALVQTILCVSIADPDEFTERADDILVSLFGE